jgi:hypothetical protein
MIAAASRTRTGVEEFKRRISSLRHVKTWPSTCTRVRARPPRASRIARLRSMWGDGRQRRLQSSLFCTGLAPGKLQVRPAGSEAPSLPLLIRKHSRADLTIGDAPRWSMTA